MTVGQLTALAICVLGLGTYTSVRGLLVHIKLRKALQDRKNLKLPQGENDQHTDVGCMVCRYIS